MSRHRQLPHLTHLSAQYAPQTPGGGPSEDQDLLQQLLLPKELEFLVRSVAATRPCREANLSCLLVALARLTYHPGAGPLTRLDWEAVKARGLTSALELVGVVLGPLSAPGGPPSPGRHWHPRSRHGSSPPSPTTFNTSFTPTPAAPAPSTAIIPTTGAVTPTSAPSPSTPTHTTAAHPNPSTATASDTATPDPTHSHATDSENGSSARETSGPSRPGVGGSGARAALVLVQLHTRRQAVLQSMQFQRRFLARLWYRYVNLENVLRRARRRKVNSRRQAEDLQEEVRAPFLRG